MALHEIDDICSFFLWFHLKNRSFTFIRTIVGYFGTSTFSIAFKNHPNVCNSAMEQSKWSLKSFWFESKCWLWPRAFECHRARTYTNEQRRVADGEKVRLYSLWTNTFESCRHTTRNSATISWEEITPGVHTAPMDNDLQRMYGCDMCGACKKRNQ